MRRVDRAAQPPERPRRGRDAEQRGLQQVARTGTRTASRAR